MPRKLGLKLNTVLAGLELVWDRQSSDLTPDFKVTGDFAVGDNITLEIYNDAAFTSAETSASNIIDATELGLLTLTFDIDPLAPGTYYVRVKNTRGRQSRFSNTEVITLI